MIMSSTHNTYSVEHQIKTYQLLFFDRTDAQQIYALYGIYAMNIIFLRSLCK